MVWKAPLLSAQRIGTRRVQAVRHGRVSRHQEALPKTIPYDSDRRAAFPEATVSSVKCLTGKDTIITACQRSFTPENISSYILKHLAEWASEHLGERIEKVVVTVPAYFSGAQ